MHTTVLISVSYQNVNEDKTYMNPLPKIDICTDILIHLVKEDVRAVIVHRLKFFER